MMCGCDCNQPEFCEVENVKARKRHKCGECLDNIEPGEHYERVSGKWEGGVETIKTCMQCVEMRDEMKLECWCYGQLIDEVSDDDWDHLSSVQSFRIRRAVNYETIQQGKAISNV